METPIEDIKKIIDKVFGDASVGQKETRIRLWSIQAEVVDHIDACIDSLADQP